MSTARQIPCPTPSCGRLLDVKLTERGRPSVSCKLSEGGCGWSGFVNARKGVAMWAGNPIPRINPVEKPKKEPAVATAIAPTPEKKSEGRGFKFAWEE
jgi:hypothetical protein